MFGWWAGVIFPFLKILSEAESHKDRSPVDKLSTMTRNRLPVGVINRMEGHFHFSWLWTKFTGKCVTLLANGCVPCWKGKSIALLDWFQSCIISFKNYENKFLDKFFEKYFHFYWKFDNSLFNELATVLISLPLLSWLWLKPRKKINKSRKSHFCFFYFSWDTLKMH